ncbi:hypothetical protein ABK040_016716 [Willaertia magna]
MTDGREDISFSQNTNLQDELLSEGNEDEELMNILDEISSTSSIDDDIEQTIFSNDDILLTHKEIINKQNSFLQLDEKERFEILKQSSELQQTKYQLQKLFIPFEIISNNSTSDFQHVTVLTVPKEEEIERKKMLLKYLKVDQTNNQIDELIDNDELSGTSSITSNIKNQLLEDEISGGTLSSSSSSVLDPDAYLQEILNDDYIYYHPKKKMINEGNNNFNSPLTNALISSLDKEITAKEYFQGKQLLQQNYLSMMKMDIVKSTSEYLQKNRHEIGLCKVIKVSSTILAVGTSYGITVIFSNSSNKVMQLKLKQINNQTPPKRISRDNSMNSPMSPSSLSSNSLNNSFISQINQYNGVTCMDITPTGTFIVCGYEYGDIALWNLQTNELIKRINGGNLSDSEFNTPIDHIQFLKNNPYKILVSSLGVIKLITFKERLLSSMGYIHESVLVAEGSFGLIREMKILPEGEAYHPSNDFLIVTIANDINVFVLCLEPSVKVLCKFTKPENISRYHSCLPNIAWRKVLAPIQFMTSHEAMTSKRVKGKPPILAISWGNVLNLFQLEIELSQESNNVPENIEMFRVSCMEFKNDIIGLSWCGEQTLLIIDRIHHATIVDPFALKRVEDQSISFDINQIVNKSQQLVDTLSEQEKQSIAHNLVYHSRYDIYTNDGKFILHPRPCFHSTICTKPSDGVVYLLAYNEIDSENQVVVSIKVLNWRQRIDKLIDIGCWNEALKLSLNFYQGKGIAVIGLPTDSTLRKQLAGDIISDVLNNYLENSLKVGVDSFVNEKHQEQFYTDLANTCIKYSLAIERSEPIFTTFYEQFVKKNKEELFLKLIESHIKNGELTDNIVVPNVFIDKIVQRHLSQLECNFNELETILLNLDFNDNNNNINFCKTLIETCSEHCMFKALIHICNKGLGDYVLPLTELMIILFQTNIPPTTQSNINELIFQYLENCYEGRSFSKHQIPLSLLPDIKLQLLNYIFQKTNNKNVIVYKDTKRKSRIAIDDTYKRHHSLSRLIILNSKRFFKWMQTIFHETSSNPLDSKPSQTSNQSPITRQDIFDSLLFVFVHAPNNISNHPIDAFSPWEIRTKKSSIEEEKEGVTWMPSLEDTIYFYLFLVKELTLPCNEIKVKVDTIHRIFSTLCYEGNLFDENINETQHDLVMILEKLNNILSEDKRLLKIDELITCCRNARFYKVLISLYTSLNDYEKVLDAYLSDTDLRQKVFEYIYGMIQIGDELIYTKIKQATLNHLSQLIECNSDATAHLIIMHFTSEHDKVVYYLNKYPKLQFQYLKNIIGVEHASETMNELLKRKGLTLDRTIHLKYFQLMCEFEPQSVYPYVSSERDYPLDECLKFCKQYNILDATSYLLERSGDVAEAVKLYLEKVDEQLKILSKRCVEQEDSLASQFNPQQQQEEEDKGTIENKQKPLGPPLTDLFYLLHEFDIKYQEELEEIQQRKKKAIITSKNNKKTMDDNENNNETKTELVGWASKMASLINLFTKSTSKTTNTNDANITMNISQKLLLESRSTTEIFRDLNEKHRREIEIQIYTNCMLSILQSPEFIHFKQLITNIVNMCKRNIENGRLEDHELEQLWFQLLDRMVIPLRELFQSYLRSSPMLSPNLSAMLKQLDEMNQSNSLTKKDSFYQNEEEEEEDNNSDKLTEDSLSDHELDIDENIKDHKEMIENAIKRKEKLQQEIRYQFDKQMIKTVDEKIKKLDKRIEAWRKIVLELEEQKIKEEERKEKERSDPFAPRNLNNRPCNLFLQVCLNHLFKFIFTEMSNASSSINDEINFEENEQPVNKKITVKINASRFSVFRLLQKATWNYRNDIYGYFKEPLLELYDKCGFELMLYHSINSLLENDIYRLFYDCVKAKLKGVNPTLPICRLCNQSIHKLDEDTNEELKVFYCGHAFHVRCLELIHGDDNCPLCRHQQLNKNHPSNYTSEVKTKEHKLKEKKKAMTGSKILHNNTEDIVNNQSINLHKKQRLRRLEDKLDQIMYKDRLTLLDDKVWESKKFNEEGTLDKNIYLREIKKKFSYKPTNRTMNDKIISTKRNVIENYMIQTVEEDDINNVSQSTTPQEDKVQVRSERNDFVPTLKRKLVESFFDFLE